MEKNYNKENRGTRSNSGNNKDNRGSYSGEGRGGFRGENRGGFRGEGRGGFQGENRGGENRSGDQRGESNDLMVFGTRAVIEAVKSGKEFEKLFIQAGLQNELIKELITLLRKEGVLFQFVPSEKLNRITSKNHQGVAGFLTAISYQNLETLLPLLFESGKTPLLMLLDRITDIRNFGAIARTAECAGVDAIIIPSRGGAQINADSIKTSAGALHRLPVCREDNLKNTIQFLKESGVQVIACTEKASVDYYKADLTGPAVVVLGSEEDGISGEYLKMADQKVKIPMMGVIQSLNVSVASGVLLFEVNRQRHNLT